MPIQARMKVDTILTSVYGREVKMSVVTNGGEDDPNKSFANFTPVGELRLVITNPDAKDEFEVGKEYDISFAPKAEAQTP